MPRPIPYRIRIGVTGHRTSPHFPSKVPLFRQVQSLLGIKVDGTIDMNCTVMQFFDLNSREIMDKAKHTPIAYSVLSPLTEGADQIASEAILASSYSSLKAVLPLSQKDYYTHFKSAEARLAFLKLLQKDLHPTLIKELPQFSHLTGSHFTQALEEAYRSVGFYIVDHCDLLLIIWDGRNDPDSGVCRILQYASMVRTPRLVIHVDQQSTDRVQLFPEKGLNAHGLERLEQFNTQLILSTQELNFVDKYSNKLFCQHTAIKQFHPKLIHTVQNELHPYYVKALSQAEKNRWIYRKTGTWAHRLATVAVLTIGWGILYPPFYQISFLIELIILLFVFGLILHANWRRVHRNWTENRFLAERVRIGQFFFIVNLPMPKLHHEPFQGIANHIDWIARVWNELSDRLLKQNHLVPGREFSPQQVEWLRTVLIREQQKWHTNNATRTNRLNRQYEKGGLLVYVAALIAAGMHVIPYYFLHTVHPVWPDRIITFFALGLPAVGAMIEGIRRIMDYSRDYKRYQKMQLSLDGLDARFAMVEDKKRLNELMIETDNLLMHEVHDWLLMRSALELEPVA